MSTLVSFKDFRERQPSKNTDFQALLRQAVDLAHFEAQIAPDEWHIATQGGDIRWMHRVVAERVVTQRLFTPAVILSIPYVVDLLGRFSRPGAILNIGALVLEMAKRAERDASFQPIADMAFLRYTLGSMQHRRGMIRDYPGYLLAIGRNAYYQWACRQRCHAGSLMAQAFQPLGDVVRAEIGSRMFR